ncbi:MAG: VOC family protein [Roseibium sp.]|uniref:VOC family protein n=1 Tax=Roseibium sp. TaxID=1936156 RepID=UPI001B050B71|nr:VOC family protein [Roseibium sp.]MBO6892890.1 VOC family protein [Roseibium sp.]MBO6927991.1 VOC family protein [Roseibium sp.]
MQRSFTNILTEEVATTAAFYETLLGLTAKFSSDWFVNLADPDNPALELGILKQTHEIVPARAQKATAGIILTFVVDDCDAVYQRAQEMNANIVEAPREMPYGQRRMILRDPAGTFIDVSSLI